LRQQGVDAGLLSPELWEKLLHWTGDKTREEACVNIALGRRSSQELAIRLNILIDDEGGSDQMRLGAADWVSPQQEIASHHHQRQAILVDGREGNSIHFQTCCHPIPGDNIIGYLGKGEGLQVHTNDCQVALRMLSKDSDKWVEVEWGKEVAGGLGASQHDAGRAAWLHAATDVIEGDALRPRPIPPRNLRLGLYRGGRRPIDLYRRLYTGINGAPMPGVGPSGPGGKGSVADAEIWHIVNYIRSLPYEFDGELGADRPMVAQDRL
jgi:hypothetical protein